MADRLSAGYERMGHVLVALAVMFAIGACGSARSNGTSAPMLEAGQVAPIEGSPEQTVLELRLSKSHVAPVEGSPEQTAVELAH